MRCVTLWHEPGAHVSPFRGADPQDHIRSRLRPSGPGLGKPRGRLDLRTWPRIRISLADRAAAEDGLHSGFAVPILVRGECLGVLEFFSRELRPPDAGMLEMMTNLGRQIGQFIERHQMHARVVQSEKLASLGMLSAGVAHEINNPLAYIANNLAVLERDIGSLLMLVATYEKAHDLLASQRPDSLAEIDRLNDECDLAYIRENLDKILRSTRQGVKRVAEIVQEPPRLCPARPRRDRPGRYPRGDRIGPRDDPRPAPATTDRPGGATGRSPLVAAHPSRSTRCS